MIRFDVRLKELRQEIGLTQRGLAKKVGMSQHAISNWESNQSVPNANAVAILAKFFNVSTDYILGLVD